MSPLSLIHPDLTKSEYMDTRPHFEIMIHNQPEYNMDDEINFVPYVLQYDHPSTKAYLYEMFKECFQFSCFKGFFHPKKEKIQ